MSAPRVSVVIPTFDRDRMLQEAVESALAQTCGDLEVIVVDDGSTDGSLEAVRAHPDSRVRVVLLDHSGIPAVARNAGLAASSGELVAFLDSDDVWLPNKLERQLAVLDRERSVGLVCSNAFVIDGHGVDSGRLYLRRELGASGEVLSLLLRDNFVITSSVIVRRSVLGRTGAFAELSQLRTIDDYDLWLRVAAVTDLAYMPEPLLSYRDHPGSIRLESSRAGHWTSIVLALDRLDDFGGQRAQRHRTAIRSRRAEAGVAAARSRRVEQGAREAMREAARAIRRDPVAMARLTVASVGARARHAARRVPGARKLRR